MTQLMPPAADERLDRLIRELLTERAEDVAAEALSVEAMVERIATRGRPGVGARGWVLVAAAAMLTVLVVSGALAVGGAIHLPSLLVPAPLPSPAPSSPSLTPAASPGPGSERVYGWPDTSANKAGWYSWNGSACGRYCNSGWMHNGYGSGNLEIKIEVLPEGSEATEGGSAVTVAGHEAIHRRIDDRDEVWIVDIEGKTIAIHLTTEPDTSRAEMAEAYAIIDSMRTEARDNGLGFRLIFRLATDDWDSG
jgi:hypothetical protein